MARTIDYWYNYIIQQKNATPALNGLNSTSKTASYNLMAYVVAVAAWALDNILEASGIDLTNLIATKKPHGIKWYRDLALRFQFGQGINKDTGEYDNIGLTDEQVTSQKIIVQSAVIELPAGNQDDLRVKVVKLSNGDYAQLSADELAALKIYMNACKDAGVHLLIESLPPDSLRLQIDVYFEPLVLRADGSRIDGNASTPVADAINAYLQNLLFNGEYANTRLSDAINAVNGVALSSIKLSQAKYGNYAFTNIDEIYIPDAGYLRIPDNMLTINYKQYVPY